MFGYQVLPDKHRCPTCNSRLYKCQECDSVVRIDDARFTVYDGRVLAWCKQHAPSDSSVCAEEAIKKDREDNCCFKCCERVGSDDLTIYEWRDEYGDLVRCVGICNTCRETADADPSLLKRD